MNESETKTFELFADFCKHLEFYLDITFKNSHQKGVGGLWCDGVNPRVHNDPQLTKKHVNDTRKIDTWAFIGKDGQDIYQMTIRFGKYSLRRYAKDRSLNDCIPPADTMDWYDIDINKKTIEIRLR